MEFGTALIMGTVIGVISSLYLIAFLLEWNKAIYISDFAFMII
jgi:preprotein translocase subunit SecF